jgi:hypothetical protein
MSEVSGEKREPSGVSYSWRGERPLDPNAPKLHGTSEIRLENADRATGYFTTLSDTQPEVNAGRPGPICVQTPRTWTSWADPMTGIVRI